MAAAALHRDRLGLELTAASGEAARAFDDTVWAYVGFSREPGVPLKRALQADPAMPMALCLQGYFMHLMGLPGLIPKARAALSSLQKISAMNPREKMHAAALGAWCEGELERTCAILEGILASYPRDFLASSLPTIFISTWAMRPAYATARHARSRPGTRARQATATCSRCTPSGWRKAAITRRPSAQAGVRPKSTPADPWAVHAVAHVIGDAGPRGRRRRLDRDARAALGYGQLLPLPPLVAPGAHALGAGRPEEALKLYDARIWNDGSSENLSLCNDISMLARLEIAGVDVGGRWEAAAKVVREQSGGSVMAFVDAHYALALGSVPPLEEARHDRPRCTARSATPSAMRRLPGAARTMRARWPRSRRCAKSCTASAAATRSATCSR